MCSGEILLEHLHDAAIIYLCAHLVRCHYGPAFLAAAVLFTVVILTTAQCHRYFSQASYFGPIIQVAFIGP